MQSKKFRNYQFYVGDLVKPNWNPKEPIGLGIVIDVNFNSIYNNNITVAWQLAGTKKESEIDLILLEQVLD